MKEYKHIAFLPLSLTLLLTSCGTLGNDNSQVRLSSPHTGITTTMRSEIVTHPSYETQNEQTFVIQKKCKSLSFDGGYTLYIDKNDKYILIDKDKISIKELNLIDDDKNNITLFCKDGIVTCKQGDKEIKDFIYKGVRILVIDGEVYYAGSKLEYFDDSFSSFNIIDDIYIECIGEDKFVIKKDGKVVSDPVIIKDDNGAEYTFEAAEKGIEIVNNNNELMLSLVIGGKYIDDANGHVIVNGKKMVPPGSNDIKTNTTTTTAATTAAPKKPTVTTVKKETVVITQAPVSYEEPDTGYIYEEPSAPVVTESPMANINNVNISDQTSEMLGYVNELRKQYGLSEVYGLEDLDKASAVRAKETAEQYVEGEHLPHTRPDGSNYDNIITEIGLPDWTSICENLSYGINCNDSVHDAFETWLNSPPHKQNMLSETVKYMSVAVYSEQRGDDTYYFWEQLFYNDTF